MYIHVIYITLSICCSLRNGLVMVDIRPNQLGPSRADDLFKYGEAYCIDRLYVIMLGRVYASLLGSDCA